MVRWLRLSHFLFLKVKIVFQTTYTPIKCAVRTERNFMKTEIILLIILGLAAITAVIVFVTIYAKKKRKIANNKQILLQGKASSAKYMNNAIAIECAEKFADDFMKKILSPDLRNTRIENIVVESRIIGGLISGRNTDSPYCNKVGIVDSIPYKYAIYSTYFDFYKKNLKPISGEIETSAFLYAVFQNICIQIASRLPKDPSGTEYRIEVSESIENNIIMAKFTYIAPNGQYLPLQDW